MRASSRRGISVVAALAVAGLVALPRAQAVPAVVATVAVGSVPAGVAADPTSGRVYVANYGSGDVSVIDEASLSVVATIPVGSNPVGVAADPTSGRVYVANTGSGDVSVIDEASLSVVATVPVEANPWGVAADPTSGRVYVANISSGTVSVIDEASLSVVATVPVESYPYGVAADPTSGRVYVGNNSSDTVSVIEDLPPAVAITGYPQDPTNQTQATFSFAGRGDFACSLDGAGFLPCQGAVAYYGGLSEGRHEFTVRASDRTWPGLTASASFTWTVDVTPPESTVDPPLLAVSHPPLQTPLTGSAQDALAGVDRVRVRFTPQTPLGQARATLATLACTPDRRSCTWSAQPPEAPGLYAVTVQGVDRAGNAEAAPPVVVVAVL